MTDQSGINGAQQQPSWTFTFTVAEWITIRSGVLKLPGEICIPVLQKLEQQMMAAQNAAQTTSPLNQGAIQ